MENNLDFLLDPYEFYRLNRLENNVKFFQLNEEFNSPGFWAIFSYAEALDIFKNVVSTSKNISLVKDDNKRIYFDNHLLNKDKDEHSNLRKLTAKFFSAKLLERYTESISEIVKCNLKHIKMQSKIDLISEYAKKIPINVIMEIIGIKVSNVEQIVRWVDCILIDSLLINEDMKLRRRHALEEFCLFIRQQVANKYEHNENSLIYSLIESSESKKISSDDLISYITFLIVAGYETTADLIGNSLYILLTNKKELDNVIHNTNSIDYFIEEVLRFESPVQRSTFRVLTQSFKIGDVILSEGDEVRIFLGSVNRDEKIFKAADVFVSHRNPNPHLAFGFGPHNCLGQFLARSEAKIAILEIAPYLNNFNIIDTKVIWKKSNFSRGLVKLDVLKN